MLSPVIVFYARVPGLPSVSVIWSTCSVCVPALALVSPFVLVYALAVHWCQVRDSGVASMTLSGSRSDSLGGFRIVRALVASCAILCLSCGCVWDMVCPVSAHKGCALCVPHLGQCGLSVVDISAPSAAFAVPHPSHPLCTLWVARCAPGPTLIWASGWYSLCASWGPLLIGWVLWCPFVTVVHLSDRAGYHLVPVVLLSPLCTLGRSRCVLLDPVCLVDLLAPGCDRL